MGSDLSGSRCARNAMVSIHAPVWGATLNCLYHTIFVTFQSTLPYGERLSTPLFAAFIPRFNPRSRMGSDIIKLPRICFFIVSIHAPVWGATRRASWAPLWPYVSIHAPVWGATSGVIFFDRLLLVSIHAPVWGATDFAIDYIETCVFQSTLPYGERQYQFPTLTKTGGFNPRSRMGSDGVTNEYWELLVVSIHAPVWGATAYHHRMTQFVKFQSTLPYGERR